MQTINTYYKDYLSLKHFVNNHHKLLFPNNNRAILVQIFCGVLNKNYIQTISKQISTLVPGIQVIGTTTSGEIMDGLTYEFKIVLSFSIFYHSDIKLTCIEKNDMDDYQLGRAIATSLNSDKARVLILFATGETVNASYLLKGIQDINADLPVAGGNAGNNFSHTQSLVFGNDKVTDCGAAGVVLESDHLIVSCHNHLGWQPIGKEMTITRSSGSRVYTIDNMPAYKVYQKYLGIDDNSDIRDVFAFPLEICQHGLQTARSPYFHFDDDSIGFLSDMPEGEKVHFSFGHIEMILKKIDDLVQRVRCQPVESIFVYSCAARRIFLQEAAQIETLPLQGIAPTAGFFTFGEFYHYNQNNYLLNTTMTTLALSESSVTSATQSQASIWPGGTNSKAAGGETNADRNIGVLKALTRLVNTVTSELNEKTSELQKANEQLRYTGSHDALTGLYNRRIFEQEIQKLQQLEKISVGIIICDVNGLKIINDTLGHSNGDKILKTTANILRSLFDPQDVVARIGGDEFSILLPNSSPARIENFCREIRTAVTRYNQQNPAVPLSISIGYSCSQEKTDMEAILKEADDKMYRQKLHQDQSIHSDLVDTLIRTLEERDIITEEHSYRLQNLLLQLALENGISPDNSADLCLFAHFHDIGKVAIKDKVLFKPGPLTMDEKKEMQRHCEIGYRIARSSADLLPVAEWILKHHEWVNGQGYPLGLKGDAIPFECRMLAIVDAYDAMTNDRPYRKAMTRQTALEEIKRCAGTQFDPLLVEKFINIMIKDNTPTTNTRFPAADFSTQNGS